MNVNPASADASGDQLTTKLSPLSVGATVARLTELATSGGLKLFAVIDHSREARAAGLELRETKVVIFGSPEAVRCDGLPIENAAARPCGRRAMPS